jgi:hypothetical protein
LIGRFLRQAQASDQLVTLGLAVAISTIFFFIAPFAWVPLVKIPLFIPLNDGAVTINYLATSVFFAALFIARGRSELLFLICGRRC